MTHSLRIFASKALFLFPLLEGRKKEKLLLNSQVETEEETQKEFVREIFIFISQFHLFEA